MKKIILFSSIACALTACGGDGADPAPRTEAPAVSGKLTYTDESGKVVGELRGEELAGLYLVGTDNQSFGGLGVRTLQQKEVSPEFLPLVVALDSQKNTENPNIYLPLTIIQELSKSIGGSAICFIGYPEACKAELLVDTKTGKIEWTQDQVKIMKPKNSEAPNNSGGLDEAEYEYFYISGSFTSIISPSSLIFKKNRFPERSINSSLNDSELGNILFTQIEYEYKYPKLSSPPVMPPPSEKHLSLYGESYSLDINLTTSTLNTYHREENSLRYEWECLENCSVQITATPTGQRISIQNAKLRNTAYPLQTIELNGAIDFKPHNSKISMKKHVINTDQFLISTSVSNNTARYSASFPAPLEASACSSGKEIIIERENQTIKSVEVTCDHWDSVTKTNVQTVFGVCGLPNTPTCTGASLSADGHTFSFVKTKLSNNEELNGTLYFAGVAAADPAVTTP